MVKFRGLTSNAIVWVIDWRSQCYSISKLWSLYLILIGYRLLSRRQCHHFSWSPVVLLLSRCFESNIKHKCHEFIINWNRTNLYQLEIFADRNLRNGFDFEVNFRANQNPMKLIVLKIKLPDSSPKGSL